MTPWTVACQAPLSTGFSKQEYWSRLLFPPPGDLPHPGIEPASLASPALARGFFTSGATREALSTRKEPHKRNELGSRQSMSSSPAAHTTLVPKGFPCGPGLCSSEQKTVSSAWLGPESHGQDRNHPFICKDPLPSPVSFKDWGRGQN